jgi:hypothetical protein
MGLIRKFRLKFPWEFVLYFGQYGIAETTLFIIN